MPKPREVRVILPRLLAIRLPTPCSPRVLRLLERLLESEMSGRT